jgi:hypothetical protein
MRRRQLDTPIFAAIIDYWHFSRFHYAFQQRRQLILMIGISRHIDATPPFSWLIFRHYARFRHWLRHYYFRRRLRHWHFHATIRHIERHATPLRHYYAIIISHAAIDADYYATPLRHDIDAISWCFSMPRHYAII